MVVDCGTASKAAQPDDCPRLRSDGERHARQRGPIMRWAPHRVAIAFALGGCVASASQPLLDRDAELVGSDMAWWEAQLNRTLPDGSDVERDFETWLSKVQFIVDDGALPKLVVPLLPKIPQLTLELKITGVMCNQLRIGELHGIGSGRQQPPLQRTPPSPGTWGLTAKRVALRCSGVVAYSASIGISGVAIAEVQAASASLGANLRLNSSDTAEPRVPDSMTFEGCTSDLGLSIQIDGGTLWTQILDKFPAVMNAVRDGVNRAANKALCGPALQAAARKLNAQLANFHTVAHRMIEAKASQEPPWNASYVKWQQVRPVQWLQQAQEREVGLGPTLTLPLRGWAGLHPWKRKRQ